MFEKYNRLNIDGKRKVRTYVDDLITSEKYKIKPSSPSEYEQEADEFAKMAREQFLLEKRQEQKAYFAKELDAG